MKRTDKAWQRLVQAAREVPDDRELMAPYGFATRVAAKAFEKQRPSMSLVERFSLRALGVSCLLAVLGAVSNYSVIAQSTGASSSESIFAVDDPAAIVLGENENE